MNIRKLHSLAISPIRLLFLRTSKIPASRSLGLALYKTGLALALEVLSAMPEIKSIYSKTRMDEGFFVGQSDIDLVVVAADMPLEEEISFLKRYHRKFLALRTLFPFLVIELYFEREFYSHQKVRHTEIFRSGKHFKDWTLLHGAESRLRFEDNESEPSGWVIRDAYENILLNIYESRLSGERDFRRLYKFTLGIARTSFMSEKGRAPEGDMECKSFLESKGADPAFANSLLSMPERGFTANGDFLSEAVYWNIKLIEGLGERLRKGERIDVSGSLEPDAPIRKEAADFARRIAKTGVKSIILSRIPLRKPSHYLYIILPETSIGEFKKTFQSLMENLASLPALKKDLSAGIKNRFQQDFAIFPLPLTSRTLDNTCFAEGCNPFETVSLPLGVVLAGPAAEIPVDSRHIKKSFRRHIHLHSLFAVKNILLPRFLRPAGKNDEALEWLKAYRLLSLKDRVCLSGANQEYAKTFGAQKESDTPESKYLMARKMLDEIWES